MENEVKEMDNLGARISIRRPDEKLTASQKVEVAGLLYLIIGGAISAICYLFGVEWVANLWLTLMLGFIALGVMLGPIMAGIEFIEKGEKTTGEVIILAWVTFIIIVAMSK